jgi:hypothetical protein
LSIVPDQRAEDAGVAVRRAQRFRAALAERNSGRRRSQSATALVAGPASITKSFALTFVSCPTKAAFAAKMLCYNIAYD